MSDSVPQNTSGDQGDKVSLRHVASTAGRFVGQNLTSIVFGVILVAILVVLIVIAVESGSSKSSFGASNLDSGMTNSQWQNGGDSAASSSDALSKKDRPSAAQMIKEAGLDAPAANASDTEWAKYEADDLNLLQATSSPLYPPAVDISTTV